MIKYSTILFYFIGLSISQISVSNHIKIAFSDEHKLARGTFSFHERATSLHQHELIFSIKQENVKEMAAYLDDVSNPDSMNYRNWLSFNEVGQLISNPDATRTVSDFLKSEGVDIKWVSPHGEYIRAIAPIKVWESIMNTKFFRCEDRQFKKARLYYRAKDYYLPLSVSKHIFAVFNTIQIPPEIRSSSYHSEVPNILETRTSRSNSLVKERGLLSSTAASIVTIKSLNQLYSVGNNTGSAQQQQTVVETADENFSPLDLTRFQQKNNLPIQAAISINHHNISDCSNVMESCREGNLDIQYIMGMAQGTKSVYWYESQQMQDPFLAWILEVSSSSKPSLSNSISWGAFEQVTLNFIIRDILKPLN